VLASRTEYAKLATAGGFVSNGDHILTIDSLLINKPGYPEITFTAFQGRDVTGNCQHHQMV
jgi:hypothetical protein